MSIRVLCVVDDPMDLAETVTSLETEDSSLDIVTTTSVADAWSILDDHDIDCILAAHHLPDETGLQFLSELRETNEAIPFILFTTDGDAAIASEAIAAGVTDYLHTQPNSTHSLRLANRIKHAVNEYRATRQQALTVERMTDAIFELDNDWQFRSIDDSAIEIFGVPRDEYIGQSIWEISPALSDTPFETALKTVMETRDAETVEDYYPPLGGWFHVDIYPAADGGLAVYFRDISDLKIQERRLDALNDILADLVTANRPEDVCTIITNQANQILPLTHPTIALLDTDGVSITVRAATEAMRDWIETADILDQDGSAWTAFVDGDPTLIDLADDDATALDVPQAYIAPLGNHGVFICGLADHVTETTAIDNSITTLINDTHATLERLDQTTELRQRAAQLATRDRRLNRITRINNIIRNIDQALIDAKTRQDVYQIICDELGDDGPYRFVWIGEHDATTGRIEPTASAGFDKGYLDSLTPRYTTTDSITTATTTSPPNAHPHAPDTPTGADSNASHPTRGEIDPDANSPSEEPDATWQDQPPTGNADNGTTNDSRPGEPPPIRDESPSPGENEHYPIVHVIETGEVQTIEDIFDNPPLSEWRKAAFQRGFRSLIVVPITYHNRVYAAISAFVERPKEFDEVERQILTELGETAGYAINAIDRRHAFLSDTIIELTLRVDPASIPLLEPVAGMSGTFTLDHVIPSQEGSYRVFFTVTGIDPADVKAFARNSPLVNESAHVAGDQDDARFEWVVTEESVIGWLLDYGVVPRSLMVHDGNCTVTVEVPHTEDVSQFIDHYSDTYGVMELLARHEKERPVQTRQEVTHAIDEALTDRQQEVLQTAYFNGYFKSPRERTGSEIAESLDISQATFNTHLRTALRKLVGLLYDAAEH